jgi:glycosyltransferase involved in cell wall biosynthesis
MLKVLIWGTVADGPCAFFRAGQLFDKPLAALGVEMRHIGGLDNDGRRILDRHGNLIDHDKLPPSELLGMLDRGDARLDCNVDLEPIEWADVILFRRYYRADHDLVTAALWDVVESRTDKGIVYDVDDLLLGPAPSWNSLAPEMTAAEGMVKRMARRADLLTVSTPTLARRFGRLNPNVRVVRNAVDASLYVPTEPRPEGERSRVVYYGNSSRMRDYAGYPDLSGKWSGGYPKAAVQDHRQRLHTIFLGAENGQPRGFDETRPYVRGLPEFAQALGNTHGDVGLAPVFGDEFDRSKSELHWLEYTAAGMATIATRYNGDGPYNVIRDGVDGVLAKGRQEWSDGLRRLLEPSYRADVAGAAHERILTDYDYRVRAQEWADCFRWAAEHRGVGLA